MSNSNKTLYIILAVIAVGLLILFGLRGCENPYKKALRESTEMKAGTPDTITIRTVDTVWREKRITEVIRITEEKIVRYGKDSSRFDTTITKDDSSIRVAGTTFPAIDSLRLDVASLLKYPEITKTDTILISRVDTLQITKIIETASEVPWYDRFWTGVAASAIPVIAYIFLQK
jgi:hypothetical protein